MSRQVAEGHKEIKKNISSSGSGLGHFQVWEREGVDLCACSVLISPGLSSEL